MKITERDVLHVARLARLSLEPGETSRFALQLDRIIGFIDALNEVDITDIPPTASNLDVKNVVRPDEARQEFKADEILANAPDRTDDFFRVPRIIDTE